MTVRVQKEPFDPGKELNAFTSGDAEMGAIVTFTGVVRDVDGKLTHMMIEHYPGMTQTAIEKIEAEAVDRWKLGNSLIIHRFGALKPGANIMMVATAARHRADAFSAAEFLMDYLKSRAPFWKNEITETGASWVEATAVDEEALKRW